jgi:ribosomal protein S17
MERNLRKERTGVVFSNKMDKTITVAVKWKEKHPIYGKFVNKTKNTMLMTRRTTVTLEIQYVSWKPVR